MAGRKTIGVEMLARDALNRVQRPYGEDIIEEVFLAIEADASLMKRYRELVAELSHNVVNQWLGIYSKELTDMDSLMEVDARRSKLITGYTKLRAPVS